MSDSDYNGWSNYETWNVNLWLSNDEGLYHEINRMADRAYSALELSANIHYLINELTPMGGGFGDLSAQDLQNVDYEEIANAWMEE